MANYLLTGASSIIGVPLFRALSERDDVLVQVSRSTSVVEKDSRFEQKRFLQWDMQNADIQNTLGNAASEQWEQRYQSAIEELPGSGRVDAVLHCAPIWLLSDNIDLLAQQGIRRIIAFSSTSIEGKQNSSSPQEQKLVKLLHTAEHECRRLCKKHSIALTVFRPTLIYGYGQGQNLAFLSKIIDRYHCFILAGAADGLRQPVHVDDLVQAVLLAVDNAKTYGKTYNLSGGETLTYRQMVVRLFAAMDKPSRMITLPVWLYRLGLLTLGKLAAFFGKTLPVDPAMADRMQQDLVFDHSAASDDFAYKPGAFLPNGINDILLATSQNKG